MYIGLFRVMLVSYKFEKLLYHFQENVVDSKKCNEVLNIFPVHYYVYMCTIMESPHLEDVHLDYFIDSGHADHRYGTKKA